MLAQDEPHYGSLVDSSCVLSVPVASLLMPAAILSLQLGLQPSSVSRDEAQPLSLDLALEFPRGVPTGQVLDTNGTISANKLHCLR